LKANRIFGLLFLCGIGQKVRTALALFPAISPKNNVKTSFATGARLCMDVTILIVTCRKALYECHDTHCDLPQGFV
jgi:hypothetical protein